MGLQQTQQMMKLAIEGRAIKQLVEEVKQAAAQSIVEVIVVQVKLWDLRRKIAMPTE